MSVNIYGMKDSANFTIVRKSTGKPILRVDYAVSSENNWSTEQIFAMNKSTRQIRWDYNKQSTVKASMEIFDLKWLSLLTGSDFVTGATNILATELLTVNGSNQVTLAATPVSGSLTIFTVQADNLTHIDEQTLGVPATTQNTYSITGTAVTFNATSCPSGTVVRVYYLKASAVTASTMTISSNVFPYNVELYLDAMIKDINGDDKFMQVYYPNAKAKGNFTLTMSANAITKLDIEFDILKDSDTDTMGTCTIL
mgnify:CR=1 FL=1